MSGELFVKCKECKNIVQRKSLKKNNFVCSLCGFNESLDFQERIDLIVDKDSFVEVNKFSEFYNPIDFPGYFEKHAKIVENTNLREAVVTGEAKISGYSVMLGVMDTRYMMGSMGVVVGEKITRLFEIASEKKYPVIIFIASGGARMQEGIFSLMQMAKTTAAVLKYNELGGLYISVLTNPTTGGVSASFSFLADIVLAEPRALIGFAGKRVIEQTINGKIPCNFQTAEFLFENGYIDKIVERKEIRNTLSKILLLHRESIKGVGSE